MEAIERITNNDDWITFLFLLVGFLLISASVINRERLKQLLMLPFNNYYLLNYDYKNLNIFSLLLFVATNLILGLYLYFLSKTFFTFEKEYSLIHFVTIEALVWIYWIIKILFEKLIALIFDITKFQSKLLFTKTSYYLSSGLYLTALLLFSKYYFNNKPSFLIVVGSFFGLLLIIRYLHIILLYKRFIISYSFYFILYLCALEIAPILIAIKISF